MNSKTLSSWMLIVAPVLFFLVMFMAFDVVIGDGANAAEDVANLLDNPTVSSIFTLITTIVVASMSIGFALLSWSKAGLDGGRYPCFNSSYDFCRDGCNNICRIGDYLSNNR